MEESNFIAVDLHIHTPASKCYEGEKNDQEYLNILRNYYKNNILILAITDHNTINGYREIQRIKYEIEQKVKILEGYSTQIPELETELLKLKEDLDLFKQLTILPGVEFEANPGIHLLLIFSPDQDLKEIDNLLETSGYTPAIQGMENPEIEISIDVIEILKLAKGLNAITIAAHVDSNKGIFNDLKGTYRSRVFKSDYLDGISVNSIVQIEKIKSLLKQPDYKRNKPLAIIQSSDHHHTSHCGRNVTYLNSKKMTFSSIVECFKNPIENISPTEKPELKNIINSLANDKNTILIDSIDLELINKSACGVLNNYYGTIIIGVTNDQYKNIKGITIDSHTIDSIIDSITNSIVPEKLFYSLSVKAIPYGGKNVIVINLKSISEKSFFYNEKYFHVDNNTLIECSSSKLLSISQIKKQEIIEEFYTNHDVRLVEINAELQLLMESKNSLQIINKINSDGILLSEILKISLVKKDPFIEFDKIPTFGEEIKNVFYSQSFASRLSDCYLRCTCPSTQTIEFDETKSYHGPSIILVPGGGTHIIENESYNIYNPNARFTTLIFNLEEEFKTLNPYVILAWMKCSLLLWHCYSLFANIDLYTPSVFKKIIIPATLFHSDTALLLEQKIKEIIKLENQFLVQKNGIAKGNSQQEDDELLMSFASNHNSKVDGFALEIDEIIHEKLSITEEESKIIYNFLVIKDIHTLEN